MSNSSPNDATLAARCRNPECGAPLGKARLCLNCGEDQRGPMTWKAGWVLQGYRLIEMIGKGGMGEVWKVCQEDDDSIQHALKFIGTARADEAMQSLFMRERRLLISINHTNVARVHRTGSTQDRQPYFVMDLVERTMLPNDKEAPPELRHVNILSFCAEHSLSIPQRLGLFIKICEAAHYLHVNGIVHRDLKPANILVAHNGNLTEPKIIDFGLAKLAADGAGEAQVADRASLLYSQTGHYKGTPTHSSPEQFRNAATVQPVSDVYSLGVILVEILTGRLPLHQNEQQLYRQQPADGSYSAELVTKLRDTPRPRLKKLIKSMSAAEQRMQAERCGTPDIKLSKLIPADLHWIVAKALQARPEDRYSSAALLVRDIQNCERHEPVSARRHTRTYLTRRFVQRHTAASIAAAFAVMSLVAGLVMSLLFLGDAKVAAGLAKEKQGEAEQALRDKNDETAKKEREAAEKEEALKKLAQTNIELTTANAKVKDEAAKALAQKTLADGKAKEANEQRELADMREKEALANKAEAEANARIAEKNLEDFWRAKIETHVRDSARALDERRRIAKVVVPGNLQWWQGRARADSTDLVAASAVHAQLTHERRAVLITQMKHPFAIQSLRPLRDGAYLGVAFSHSTFVKDTYAAGALWRTSDWRLHYQTPPVYGHDADNISIEEPWAIRFDHRHRGLPYTHVFALPNEQSNPFGKPLLEELGDSQKLLFVKPFSLVSVDSGNSEAKLPCELPVRTEVLRNGACHLSYELLGGMHDIEGLTFSNGNLFVHYWENTELEDNGRFQGFQRVKDKPMQCVQIDAKGHASACPPILKPKAPPPASSPAPSIFACSHDGVEIAQDGFAVWQTALGVKKEESDTSAEPELLLNRIERVSDATVLTSDLPSKVADVSADGTMAMVLDGEYLRLIALADHSDLWPPQVHPSRITSACFLPGNVVATGDSSGNVFVWQLIQCHLPESPAPMKPAPAWPMPAPVDAKDNPDRDDYQTPRTIAYCAERGLAVVKFPYSHHELWSVPGKQLIETFPRSRERDDIILLSPTGRYLTRYYIPGQGSNTLRGRLAVYDVDQRKWGSSLTMSASTSEDEGDFAMAFSQDGKVFATVDSASVQVWRHDLDKRPDVQLAKRGSNQVAVNADGSVIAAGALAVDGSISFYHWEGSTCREVFYRLPKARLPKGRPTWRPFKWTAHGFAIGGRVFLCVIGDWLYAVDPQQAQNLCEPVRLWPDATLKATALMVHEDGRITIRARKPTPKDDLFTPETEPVTDPQFDLDLPMLVSSLKAASGDIIGIAEQTVSTTPPRATASRFTSTNPVISKLANSLTQRHLNGLSDSLDFADLQLLNVEAHGVIPPERLASWKPAAAKSDWQAALLRDFFNFKTQYPSDDPVRDVVTLLALEQPDHAGKVITNGHDDLARGGRPRCLSEWASDLNESTARCLVEASLILAECELLMTRSGPDDLPAKLTKFNQLIRDPKSGAVLEGITGRLRRGVNDLRSELRAQVIKLAPELEDK